MDYVFMYIKEVRLKSFMMEMQESRVKLDLKVTKVKLELESLALLD